MNGRIENIPHASILIHSMRSIGYDFETAVSDIIDNSITAGAQNIEINFPIKKGVEPYLVIVDDGAGMNRSELIEAMRFGSIKVEERHKDDLGRFGLGLKTASISQCRKFVVVSKKDSQTNAFAWDLDILENNSNWEMLEIDSLEIETIPCLNEYKDKNSFTIVFWQKLDKLNKDVHVHKSKNDVFIEKIDNTEKHLSLIFHRFLQSGLTIKINKSPLNALDPFLYEHPKTITKAPQIINTKTNSGVDEKITMQVSILPYQKDLNPAHIKLIGGKLSSDDQGFYIYRNKRLMIHGTWFKIRPRQELASNARIRIDIPNSLDDIWSIDIKKQRAVLPGMLIEQLRTAVSDAIETSKKIYTFKGHTQVKEGSIWSKIVNRDGSISYHVNQESDLLVNILDELNNKTADKLQKFISLIELSLPYRDIYNSVAEKKEINRPNEHTRNIIIDQAFSLYKIYKTQKNLSAKNIIDLICNFEPFLNYNIEQELMRRIENEKI